jgi:hypothetical protein
MNNIFMYVIRKKHCEKPNCGRLENIPKELRADAQDARITMNILATKCINCQFFKSQNNFMVEFDGSQL